MILIKTKNFVKEKIGLKPGHPLWPSAYKIYKRTNGIVRIKRGIGVLPDFIIIGTQKGGTTSLFNYMVQHPNIYSPCTKEIHYYDVNYDKGENWYRAFFNTKLKRHIIKKTLHKPFITGESSPYYIYHPDVARRVKKDLPNVKIIVLLRNPIDRAYSHYNHQVEKKREHISFEEALKLEEKRLDTKSKQYWYNHRHYSYLDRGLYAQQLKKWYKHFPKEQILVLSSEEFYKSPDIETNKVFTFLKLKKHNLKTYYKINEGSYKKKKMDSKTREKLIEYYKKPNEELFELIGKKFDWNK